MRNTLCVLLLTCSLSSKPASALVPDAVNIDFEGLRRETSDIPSFPSYDEDGYHFEIIDHDPASGPDGLAVVGALHPRFYGSAAITPASDSDIVMSRLDGGLFAIASLKLIEHFDRNDADPSLMRNLTLTGWKPGGTTVTQTFAVDEVVGFETFAFSPSFTELEKLTWNMNDPTTWWNHAVRVDDIVAYTVPEPAAFSFLAALVAAVVTTAPGARIILRLRCAGRPYWLPAGE